MRFQNFKANRLVVCLKNDNIFNILTRILVKKKNFVTFFFQFNHNFTICCCILFLVMAVQQQVTTVVSHTAYSSGTWTTGICDCCSDMSTCKSFFYQVFNIVLGAYPPYFVRSPCKSQHDMDMARHGHLLMF